MSGGSMDYLCWKIEEYADKFEDKELVELAKDFAELAHDCEWYHSSDIGRGTYQVAIDKFKAKWFGKNSRDERIKHYAEELKAEYLRIWGIYDRCERCKHFTPGNVSSYGSCEFKTGCLMHTHECCERFEKNEQER